MVWFNVKTNYILNSDPKCRINKASCAAGRLNPSALLQIGIKFKKSGDDLVRGLWRGVVLLFPSGACVALSGLPVGDRAVLSHVRVDFLRSP
jgi:hypothetical protein